MSFGQMRPVGQTLYYYGAEHLFWAFSLTLVLLCSFHNLKSGGFIWWGEVRWEALPFFFRVGRYVSIWQTAAQTVSDSTHVSRYDDKHLQVMLASWRVVFRLNPYVILTFYGEHLAETLRLASQRLWYDTLHLCLVIFIHCSGREKLYELSIMLR